MIRLPRSVVCYRPIVLCTVVALSTQSLDPCTAQARARQQRSAEVESPIVSERIVPIPYLDCRTHRVGNIAFTVTNFGVFGSESASLIDPCTQEPAPSFEFPRGSAVNYLFMGGLWVGAVKGRDTLVSVGVDGWWSIHELMPAPFPEGQIITRTTRDVLPGDSLCPDVFYSADAVSEQDLVATFTDTATDNSFVEPDPVDGPHLPLGIRVAQTSYAWSAGPGRDWILMDLRMSNLSDRALEQTYVGLYMDQDVGHSTSVQAYLDDLSGFLTTAPSLLGHGLLDTINLAWTIDNDGDPQARVFTSRSATGIAGVRVLRTPEHQLKTCFNWWVSNSNPVRDWGPNLRNSQVQFPSGNLGTPVGDRAKYQLMSNGEIDYDQVYTALDHQADGWLPPPANAVVAVDLAGGQDIKYLLSFGPFAIHPGSELPLTLAFVAGANLHKDPDNYVAFIDPGNPTPYVWGLDFTEITRNAQWAAWFYDNPGVDTDGDGFRGEQVIVGSDTLYCRGDGVPDFAGPPSPPAPPIVGSAARGTVTLRFNGETTETALDPFSLRRDFEGYRVYLSTTTDELSEFRFMASRDLIDYTRFVRRPYDTAWVTLDPPFTLDSLKVLYDPLTDSVYGYPFHPDSFPAADPERALREVRINRIDPSKLDTFYYCFEAYERNERIDDTALAYQVDSLRQNVRGVIRKVFPYAARTDTLWRVDGTPFAPYYEYEYAVDGLEGARYVFFAVTPFDYGWAPMAVEPQSASIYANVVAIAIAALAGDANADGQLNVADIITVAYYLFGRGPAPRPAVEAGDADCDGDVDLVDVVVLVNHVFRGAPAPGCAPR